MAAMTLFDKVLKRSNALREWHPLWRQGQRLFNALHDTNATLANEVRGTDIDPFYDDSRCIDFYAWLTEQDGQVKAGRGIQQSSMRE